MRCGAEGCSSFSTMSASLGTPTAGLLNHTATQEARGQDASASVHEFKVFNITITSLALCILTVTGIVCSVSLIRRRRQSKQARVYESAVGGFEASLPTTPAGASAAVSDPSSGLALLLRREVRCSLRLPLALLRGRDPPKDNSRIYYIYTNPLPIGKDEEEEEEERRRKVAAMEEERRRKVAAMEEEKRSKAVRSAAGAGGVEGRRGRGGGGRGGVQEPPSLYELALEPGSGITLSSETFYMQL
ncbi:uncharacterized protein si:dkey-246e1.3 isoform X1 [Sardina pilchardus]|uniref:uncharacterized protein si:dkey-246e1.3 isoform X1 n=1 Tax=Sardina pilchardus TaxID=27697 RepID=UPI002E114A72